MTKYPLMTFFHNKNKVKHQFKSDHYNTYNLNDNVEDWQIDE